MRDAATSRATVNPDSAPCPRLVSSGRFVKQEQCERWRAKPEIGVCVRAPGRFCGFRGYHPFMLYLKDNHLLPDLQLEYRQHNSTETAVLRVLSDILLALDDGNLAMFALLDLSAAFDSFDHVTLLQRLQTSYGLTGEAINWFKS